MAVEAAYLFPHPPIIVPQVGGGREKEAAATAAGMTEVARQAAEGRYETLIYVTPHGPAFSNGLALWDMDALSGNLQDFGAGQVAYEKKVHRELVGKICHKLEEQGILCALLNGDTARRYRVRVGLDHGVLVPMSFIDRFHADYRIVHLSVGGLPPLTHYRAGMAVADAVRELGVRCAVIISGDMSHCLKDDGPYGYDPHGPRFDRAVDEAIQSSDLRALLTLPASLTGPAGECGYKPLQVGLGALDGCRVKPRLVSSEGPFGVGYKTAVFDTDGPAPSLLPLLEQSQSQYHRTLRDREDGFIRLARTTIETYIREGRIPSFASVKDDLPKGDAARLETERAGAFVSLHRGGQLRGCIGTTEPTQDTLAGEIVHNAVSACSRDPRFEPVGEGELHDLEVKVDVLFPPEPIDGPRELDVVRYGVIVSRGTRRGLLLPNLEGVKTVEEQLRIAREKAGIGPAEPVRLQRFEVERHEVKPESSPN